MFAVTTQMLHVSAQLRSMNRAIEEERTRQVTERSRLVAEQERRFRDRKEKAKRAEALTVIVACAAAVS